jgi:glutathione S-transferase
MTSMTTMVTLYYAPGASSMSAHIVLEEIGRAFGAIAIDLKKEENLSSAFVALNPRRQVPVLLIAGEALTEDLAILIRLARAFPDRDLLPKNGHLEARVIEWLSFLATTLHPSYTDFAYPSRTTTSNWATRGIRRQARARLVNYFADIEARIDGPYLVGNQFTLADAHLFVFHLWGRRSGLVDGEKTPKLFAWGEAMKTRPSIARVLEKEGISL